MKAVITRSGGFAGTSLRREVDLSEPQLAKLRQCRDRLQPANPDAFSYEITVNGETFTVRGETAERLLETLQSGN